MRDSTKDAVWEVVDVGVWTFGLVSAFAVGVVAVRDVGPLGALVPVVAIFVLGVSGYLSVGSIDDMLGSDDAEGMLCDECIGCDVDDRDD